MGEWEYDVSRIIVERHSRKLLNSLSCDVLVAGAGPSGLVAAYYLARSGLRVTIVESKLAPGGGVWGGGMERNEVVIPEEAKPVLDELDIGVEPESEGLYALDSVLLASGLAFKALQEGVTILNLVTVEDVMIKSDRLCGLVINSTGVALSALAVDPITLSARAVMDCTGHDAAITGMVLSHGFLLETDSGDMLGQGPMRARDAEQFVVEHTGGVYPGLWAAGMAVATIHGGPRMGPIFGGMLLSGKKAAVQILEALGS